MKKILLETSFSKIYIIVMIIITLLILGGYFSYAMFTVSKEKDNAISIVTGNLIYKLEVDGEETNTLTVEPNSSKEFIVILSNPNNRIARFNFYYKENLPSGVTTGYTTGEGYNIPPSEVGTNLEENGTAGSSNIYNIIVINDSSSSVTINLGVEVGLDYNDLALSSNGHLFEEIQYPTVAELVLADPGEKGDTYDDGTDTFITGEDPNNYVWYSGKLWRAVSVNNEAKTTKLVTQWCISTISYNEKNNTNFQNSHIEIWLNDTTEDGFLGNLRDPKSFIVMDAKWNATMDDRELGSLTRPRDDGTIVTDAIGLLNMYEYQESFRGTDYSNGYLNNGIFWWTLTAYNSSNVRRLRNDGGDYLSNPTDYDGVRPSINLKPNIKIVSGNGTVEDPYRLEGDYDTNLSGAYLNTRYSGEYITFGTEENNLYRIVSHENGSGTKITSAEPLKDSGTFKTLIFGDTINYSTIITMGNFLNGEYLEKYIGSSYVEMIEDSTTWYLGTVEDGSSYRLAKYIDNNMTNYQTSIIAKVGLLRLGELMAGQFNKYINNSFYWTLTPYNSSRMRTIGQDSNAVNTSISTKRSVKPSLNLKQNVIITGGDGTKNNPFKIKLG